MPISNPIAGVKVATGTYTGDDTGGRSITHGLGDTPTVIFIETAGTRFLGQRNESRIVYLTDATVAHVISVGGAPTSTVFRVGNAGNPTRSANAAGVVYTWVAFSA